MSEMSASKGPAYAAHVYPARTFRVISGANHGDPLGRPEECEPGDVYRLESETLALRLMLAMADGVQRLAAGSAVGAPGDRVTLEGRLLMIAPEGDRIEILVLCHDASGARFALPLSPIAARTDYTLLEAGPAAETAPLADLLCVSFAAGTRVTLPGGELVRIEALRPGDAVLTRDRGPQPVRWIGKATMRALGSRAPVVVAAGALGNEGDLVVSPHHRLFIYQRGARRLGGTAELLVQAKHLVDGTHVFRREGGFVDYYSLIFDRHEIIYAEGIPVESLMVNEATVRRLPPDLAAEVTVRFPGLNHSQHFGTEAGREMLDEAARAALLRPDRPA